MIKAANLQKFAPGFEPSTAEKKLIKTFGEFLKIADSVLERRLW